MYKKRKKPKVADNLFSNFSFVRMFLFVEFSAVEAKKATRMENIEWGKNSLK